MKTIGTDLFETFPIDQTVEPINPNRVALPLIYATAWEEEVERLDLEGNAAAGLLAELGHLSLEDILNQREEY